MELDRQGLLLLALHALGQGLHPKPHVRFPHAAKMSNVAHGIYILHFHFPHSVLRAYLFGDYPGDFQDTIMSTVS